MANKVERGNNPQLNAEFQKSMQKTVKDVVKKDNAQKHSAEFQNMLNSPETTAASNDHSAAEATAGEVKQEAGQDSMNALFNELYRNEAKTILQQDINQTSQFNEELQDEDSEDD